MYVYIFTCVYAYVCDIYEHICIYIYILYIYTHTKIVTYILRTLKKKLIVNSWFSKWTSKGVIDNNWKRFIIPSNSTPGKMDGQVKTHKVNNPVIVVISGCNTTIENLPIYIEHVLFELSESMSSRVKDSNHLLDIFDNMNITFLPANAILVSFEYC